MEGGAGRAMETEIEAARLPITATERAEAAPRTGSLLLVHLSLLVVALSWGSNWVSIKYLERELAAPDVLLLRLTLASSCFGGVLCVSALRRGVSGLPRVARADRPKVVLMALLGVTVNTGAVAFGAHLIPAAIGSLLSACNPIFTAIVARIFISEPLTRRKLSGVALAFLGVLIVLLYGGPNAHFSLGNALGILIALCGPVAWAFYTVLSKPLLARYDPTQFTGLVAILGTLPLLPLFAVRYPFVRQVIHFGPTQWLATTATVVFALVLGYSLWYRGLKVLAPTQLAVYVYLVPVFGTLGAWLLLGERITIFLLLGGLLILLGVIITNTTRRGPLDPTGRRGRFSLRARVRGARE